MRQVLSAGLLLCLIASAQGQKLDVRVIEAPERLGAERTEALLKRTFRPLQVVPTGMGEIVLSGSSQLLDQAEALLHRLDRPSQEVIVEFHRSQMSGETVRDRSLAVNFGDRRTPSRFLRTRGRTRSQGTRSLRLREGSSAQLFMGGEILYQSGVGPLSRVDKISAGQGLKVHLLRVDPGKGALLEFSGETSQFGTPSSVGPTVQRERIASQSYAHFGVPIQVGGFTGGETSTQGGPGGSLEFGGRPGPQGTVFLGSSRRQRQGSSGYTLVVREVKSPEGGR
jgi:hypothetical protein